jgi:hypothetical protein
LERETFALCTLHAHLPVLDRPEFQSTSLGPLKQEVAWKRPAFEVGVFEVPNLLAYKGMEPGTVGLKYFLELPILGWFQAEQKYQGEADGFVHSQTGHSPKNEVQNHYHFNGGCRVPITSTHKYKICLESFMNHQLPGKDIGVRDISIDLLTDRLAAIGNWHDEVVRQGRLVTVLDKQDSNTLYEILLLISFILRTSLPQTETANVSKYRSRLW